MDDNKDLEALMKASRGAKVPVANLVRNKSQELAIASKLVKDRDPEVVNTDDNTSYSNLNQSDLKSISDALMKSARDSDNVARMFPDMELAAQILISSILSPKDMMSTELKYKLKEQYISSEVTTALLDALKIHLDIHYGLKEKLPTMLRDILFDRGSYVTAVIPESSLDDIINSGKLTSEGLKEIYNKDSDENVSIGILGSPSDKLSRILTKEALKDFEKRKVRNNGRLTVESYDEGDNVAKSIDLGIDVSDNFSFLKMPSVMSSIAHRRVKDLIKSKTRRVAKEDRNASNQELASDNLDKRGHTDPIKTDGVTTADIQNKMFKNARAEVKQFIRVKTKEHSTRRSIGRPLFLRLPSESVIPVYAPGDEKTHAGYFALVDEYGAFVKADMNKAYGNEIANALGDQNSNLSSFLLEKASRNLRDDRYSSSTVSQAIKLYGEFVTTDLAERLRNGVYGANLTVADVNSVYQIMLHRTLHNKMTKLIYIPSELVVYMAYKYRENGTGESLNDDLQIINALSAVTTLSRVLAGVKNSIGITNAHLKLDPDDPDPNKTIEIAMHELVRTRQMSFPFGVNSPSDLVDWIQRAQMQFSFEGHADIPDLTMEVSQSNMNVTKPDDELDEDLRKRRILGYGLSPETVDNGFAAEFATTVVANNILLSKRVIQIQETFTPKLAELARVLISNDMILREELLDILRENKDAVTRYWSDDDRLVLGDERVNDVEDSFLEEILDGFSERLEINLPKPDSTTLVNQRNSLEIYLEFLDMALDNAYFPDDILSPEIAGELSNNSSQIKAIYRSAMVRNYMAINNMLPELADITTTDEEGKPKVDVFEIQKDHIVGVTRSALKFYDSMQDIIAAINTDVKNTDSLSGDGGGDYSSDSSDEEDEDSEGGEDDEFGMGDDGFGDEDGEGEGDDEFGDESDDSTESDDEGSPDEEGDGDKDKESGSVL